jgi:hypothetical protein
MQRYIAGTHQRDDLETKAPQVRIAKCCSSLLMPETRKKSAEQSTAMWRKKSARLNSRPTGIGSSEAPECT